MKLTKEDCEKWKKNPDINPLTGRQIQPMKVTYKNIKKVCEPDTDVKKGPVFNKSDCKEWMKDKTRNPITKRKLQLNAKNGLYNQLVRICLTSSQPQTNNKGVIIRKKKEIKGISSPKVPTTQENLDKNRRRLISAMRKVVGPLLNKSDTIKSRKMFAQIVNRYLGTLWPCLQDNNGKLTLGTIDGKPVVNFDRRIGSQSVYGIAYMNMGSGFGKLLKFSCKLMSATIKGHKAEIELLKKMTKFVEEETCPNMPVTYKSLRCHHQCRTSACPEVTKNGNYFLVINELANSDLQTWFKDKHDDDAYQSVIMQLLLSMYAFHQMGYLHNDTHLGNFLIHNIKPGGYWRYQIGGQNVYVPNRGYLLVMWDPGMASKIYTKTSFVGDVRRPLELIKDMEHIDLYQEMGCVSLPEHLMSPVRRIIRRIFSNKTEEEFLKNVFDDIKSGRIELSSIFIDDTPSDYLLNIRPYTCKMPKVVKNIKKTVVKRTVKK